MRFPKTILSPNLKQKIPLVVSVLLCMAHGFSQNESPLQFYFETDTVSVEQGQSFINFLVLRNLDTTEITVSNLAAVEKYPGLLLSPKSNYTLSGGEEMRFPVKFLANIDFMKMKSTMIGFQFSYTSDNEEKFQKVFFSIERDEEKHIALYSFSRENYIHPSQDGMVISMFAENRGYSPRSIKLTFQGSPNGLEIRPQELILSLEGQEKKLVEINVSVRRADFFPDYHVLVSAIDLIDNENVGSTYLKLIVLSSNRQLMRPPGPQMGKNYVEMGYNEQSNGFNYLQFRGNTEFRLGQNTQGRFNTATDYYLSEGKYNIYDTWLELERNNSLYRFGNVYGTDYDYSVSGRGIMVSTGLGPTTQLEAFGLDNNYNLYGTYFPENEGSKIGGAKYSFGKTKNLYGKLSYIYDHNPRLETDTQVANFVSAIRMDSIHRFRMEAGLSHEKGRIDNDENLGGSIGLHYEMKKGKWDFQSLNYLSSNSYAGLNRGSINFNQNLGYQFAPTGRLFMQYQNSQMKPQYLNIQETGSFWNPEFSRYYFYSHHSVRVGTQFSVANWNFLFSPLIEKQKSTNNTFAQELLSYRFRTNVGTTFNGHGIDISAEYGYSQTAASLWFHSLRTTLSYRYRGFSLNGTAQINPNDVIDLNYYNLQNKNFFNLNAYAAYNFQNAGNTLSGSVAAGINYSELYSNINKTFNANLEYRFSPTWAATGYGNYSQYESMYSNGFEGNNYQFRVGVKKYLVQSTTAGNHKLEVQLFHDANENGIFDPAETAIANEPVKLNDYVAITDKNGKVSFQNVPTGPYVLKINETRGLRMVADPNLAIDRNRKMQIGLVKKNKVTGKLQEIKQEYDRLDTYVRGVIVYATDNGGKTISTVVDQNNEFEFFLGNGTYRIYIENNKYEYINPSRKITVESGDYAQPLIFEYQKKDTEIKIKKF